MKRALVLGLLVSLTVGLPACGEKGAGGGGAKTPDAVLDRMEAIADSKEGMFVKILPLLHPDEQPAFALQMSLMAIMVISFGSMGDEDPDGPLKQLEAVLAKHGIGDDVKKMQGERPPEDMTPEQRIAEMNAAMEGVDPLALLTDCWAIADKMPGEKTISFKREAFEKARATLKVEGDRATMENTIGGPVPIVLLKADDGNWYLSAIESGLLETGPN